MKPTTVRMNPFFRLAAILSLLLVPALPDAAGGTLDLPSYGFEIEPLDGAPGDVTTTALIMFLPPAEGFASNVNVNIQPYQGSIQDYAKLSKGQFEQMGWKVVAEEQKGDAEWRCEYTGTTKSGDLHFYARALAKNGRVYLVTATAKESQWSAVQAKLRKHVDSLRLK